MKNNTFLLVLIILGALILRILPIDFPAFTSDEARIAFRSYLLVREGRDELGRTMPFLFSSISDYQLPIVSYIAASGTILFGKSDFGVRIPFVLIGVALVFLIYKIARIFNKKKHFQLFSAFLVAFSPGLIFLSKVPNEFIILTFLMVLLFYLLTRETMNVILVISVILLSFLVSKIAWFVTVPFVTVSLFFSEKIPKRTKQFIILFCLAISVAVIFIFLKIPQGERNLVENNLPLLQDIGTKNGIEKLRSQGLEAHWPFFLEKILFNKVHFFVVGFFHWLSNLQPAIFFSQFDKSGEFGFFSLGAFPKAAILPFLLGIVFLIKKGDIKQKMLVAFILIITLPILFIYPNSAERIVAMALPFMAFIIAFGLVGLKQKIIKVILSLIILEVIINLFYIFPEQKNSNDSRPAWIKAIMIDSYNASRNNKVAFSDNITDDIVSYLEWYSLLRSIDKTFDIRFPYKFRRTELFNFKIITSDDVFYNCGLDEPTEIFASKRDVDKIQKWLNIEIDRTKIVTFKDSLDNERVYRLPKTICVH